MPIEHQDKWYTSYYQAQKKHGRLKNFWNRIHFQKTDFFSSTPEDAVIVEAGCGDGNVLMTLHRKGYQNLNGFDIKIPDEPAKELSLKSGSMIQMPFEDSSVDVLYTFNALHHLTAAEQYDTFFIECRRILKNNGRLFLFEPEDNFFRKLQNIIISIPLLNRISPIKEQRVAVKEEEEEITLFHSINIKMLLKKYDFHIDLYKTYLKSFICCTSLSRGR